MATCYTPQVRELMRSDRDARLKIVSAGIKIFEKKTNANSGSGAKGDGANVKGDEYRLLQVVYQQTWCYVVLYRVIYLYMNYIDRKVYIFMSIRNLMKLY